MAKTASKFVAQAVAWIGMKESDGTHKQIIDIYNSQKPLPVGYAVKYNDAWCATFVSAVAVKLGYTDIIPCECSCPRMITLFQKAGIWIEDENRTPNPGDIIFYDWQDNGNGDNRGSSDHVGIVEKVSGGYITVIEGNYSNSVKRRTLSVNGRYIRGYGVPKYDAEATTKPADNPETKTEVKAETATSKGESTVNIELNVLKKGSTGNQVKALQRMLHAMGYGLGTKNPIDGDFGTKTDAAVRAYQKLHNLTVDGIVGKATWSALLKG
jgi:hypothetical protein